MRLELGSWRWSAFCAIRRIALRLHCGGGAGKIQLGRTRILTDLDARTVPHRFHRWILWCGLLLSLAFVGLFITLAWTEPLTRVLVGPFVLALWGLAAAAVLIRWIRYPAIFTIALDDDRIAQPFAPGRPMLPWREIVHVEPALTGGVWLSDRFREHRVRLSPELEGFPDLLEFVLARINMPPPQLPFEVRARRGPWWVEFPILLGFLAFPLFTLATRGAVRSFWLSSALLVYLSVSTVRAFRTAPLGVRVDVGCLRIWSRGQRDEYPFAWIRTVGLVRSRNWSVVPVVVTTAGRVVIVPTFGKANALPIYVALSANLAPSKGAAQQRLAADEDLASLGLRS